MTAVAKRFYAGGLMDLTDYRLDPAEPGEAWDRFVEKSAQGTVFSLSSFLRPLQAPPILYWVRKRHETVAALALSDDGRGGTALHDLIVYNGLMFAPPDPKMNGAQILSEQFRISSFVAAELPRRYPRVALATHPAFTDLRPFLWHNYGSEPRYRVDVRYTARLALDGRDWDGSLDKSRVYAAANKSRRQEIRYGLRDGVVTEPCADSALLIDLYRATFARQEVEVEQDMGELGAVIDSLAADGRMRMYVARDRDGRAGSVAVFGLDAKRAYYLYGANDPALREGSCGTMVLWDAFRDLWRLGVAEVDLEGVNSPARGYFKLSFGADLETYYHLTLDGA